MMNKMLRAACSVMVVMAVVSELRGETVKASAFGFDAVDATECVQKAIDSGAATVVIDNVGQEWLLRPIKLRHDLEIVLEDDVVVRAKPGEYKGKTDSVFKGTGIRNITIRGGKNSVIMMNKADYQDASQYARAEWRHIISLHGCKGITIRDLTLKNSGGDGIYLGSGAGQSYCQDIVYENITSLDHHRSAGGVISAVNMVVRNCRFRDSRGTPPEEGFGFEPNHPDQPIQNILLEDCELTGNHGFGSYIYTSQSASSTPPLSITYRNCLLADNDAGGFSVHPAQGGGNSLRGKVELHNCRIVAPKGKALVLANLAGGLFSVTFRDCVLDVRGNPNVPIRLSSSMSIPYGDLDLGNLKIIDSEARAPISFEGLKGAGILGLRGQPTVQIGLEGAPKPVDLAAIAASHPPNMLLQERKLDEFVGSEYVVAPGAVGRLAPSALYRGRNTFVQYLQAGQTARLTLQGHCYSTSDPTKLRIRGSIIDPAGKTLEQVQVGSDAMVYALTAKVTGLYLFDFNTVFDILTIVSDVPGHGAVARDLHLVNSKESLYFTVGASDRRVRVEICAFSGEAVQAELFNAAGEKVAWDQEPFDGIRVFDVERTPTPAPEIWKIGFVAVVEDYLVSLWSPLAPVVFTAPENQLLRRP
ncbi:MAG: right-handed parallel beta-helix repeat-containing protein [Lentisphaerae bacterium]|nr:right-handed parallel beta-helix repeat-containing protein [Lentisphaerota bacterium]